MMRARMRVRSVSRMYLVAAFVAGRSAFGQPLPSGPSEAPTALPAPAPATPAPAAPLSASDAVRAWDAAYQHARERLLAGDFAQAAQLFYQLVQSAPDPVRRWAAAELGALSADLDRRQLAFVSREELAETTLSAKAIDQRTTDEISILYLNAVFYGLGTGAWVAVQTDAESAPAVILPALAFSGLAVGGVALADSQDLFAYGVPQSIVSGGYIGLAEGIAWTFWNQARVRFFDEWDEKTIATLIWGATSLGAVAGGVVGSLVGTTPGRASYVGSTALWSGLVLGLSAVSLTENEATMDDNGLLVGALALNGGAVAGALTAGHVAPSIARVRFLDLGGIAGGLLLGGLYVAAADEKTEARPAAACVAAGAVGGLTAAWFLTVNMPRDIRPDERRATAPMPRTLRYGLAPLQAGLGLSMSGEL